ncbi:CehA/McbA family metallohydrolase [Muriicola sp. Z0-33]|uniref:CehA/McbA family metallohydrolase n=1 Tax=Muriicola sp. Z0-33 TaxID=2816957 RepID=UPI002237017E|nr:CehA/McbA family metallohydrolase [Muriicola sp. Z0-33]MCW5515275.1 CehA/McbA family metallohydrolase [Muriicola sp. Z0-33]
MKTRIVILSLVFSFVFNLFALAHDGHHDADLAELNDYLMAIQLLRIEDSRAAEIFKTWQELKYESWTIRRLTDDQDLLINSEDVMEQIAKTKAKQGQLMEECRKYFADLVQNQPAIRFSLDQSISSDWDAPVIAVQLQHFKVLLVEIQNNRNTVANVNLNSAASDEILFWNKNISIAANATRYTFVVFAPLNQTLTTSSLSINDGNGNIATALIKLDGTPQRDNRYTLLPSNDNLTHVNLPSDVDSVTKTDSSFKEVIDFNITDKESGEPLAVRVEVSDARDNKYWTPIQGAYYAVDRNRKVGWNTTLWENQPGPFFYLEGEGKLGTSPKGKTARIYHGFEYKPLELQIPEDGKVNVAMERWINMPHLGWYSGQTHIHTTDLGSPVQFSQYWPLVSRAEDLKASYILTLKGEWNTHAIYANEYPMGPRDAFSTEEHHISYGEEFRNNPYGHLAFLGLGSLIQPISTGALGEVGGPDYPANATILDKALAQGANTIAAHFGVFRANKIGQIKAGWPSTGFEMPVDVALGKIQIAEIEGNGGQTDVWYDLLNCGFKIPATAGPDWFLKDTPRVYVYLGEQKFTMDNWRKRLREGNSFITRGPMLFFSVNGEHPGSTLDVKNEQTVFEIKAQALSPNGALPVEVVYNGKVILKTSQTSIQVNLKDSGWLAVRCQGAHSNPVYINMEGRPAGQAEPAKKFIQITDRLADWVKTKGLFDNENQKTEVLRIIEEGRMVYEDIVKSATALGRE